MIYTITNYEKTKISMANIFLQYDQKAMIKKFSLEHDPDWLSLLLLIVSIVLTGKQEAFNGHMMLLKRSMKLTIMKQ